MTKRQGGEDGDDDMPAAIEKLRDAAFGTAIDPEMEATMLAGAKARLAEIESEQDPRSRAQHTVSASGRGQSPRVFISYAHDSDEHKDRVRQFATFLRTQMGVDVHLDQWADGPQRDWSLWAIDQLREADFVLVVGSPDYKRRAERKETSDVDRGVQFETAMIRDNLIRDLPSDVRRVLPVVLPGRSVDEIPSFLNVHSTTRYELKDFTFEGARDLLAAFTSVAAMPNRGDWVGVEQRTAPRSRPLTTLLPPVRRGSDIQMTDAEIDGMHRGNSIVFRPKLFTNEARGVVEYNLGRRYRRFEAVAGVLDDADDADQVGCFQVFLDDVPQRRFVATIGNPAWILHDVTEVVRLTLVTWRPDTLESPLLAGARMAGGIEARLPSLAWGDPVLVE